VCVLEGGLFLLNFRRFNFLDDLGKKYDIEKIKKENLK